MTNKVCKCGKLQEFLDEGKVEVSYFSPHREYSINLKDMDAVQVINYCPWCGDKLPQSVSDEWFNILEKLGYPFPFESRDEGVLPDEFLTDEWWKKRGL